MRREISQFDEIALEGALRLVCHHRHQPAASLLVLVFRFPSSSIMAEPVLPPPPGPVPDRDPVAVEPVVPPAGAEPAEPVEVVEVILLVFVVFAYVLRVLDQRFRLLGRLVLYWFALVFVSLHFVARFLSVLLGCVPLRLLSFPSHVVLLLVFVFRLVVSLRIFSCYRVSVCSASLFALPCSRC